MERMFRLVTGRGYFVVEPPTFELYLKKIETIFYLPGCMVVDKKSGESKQCQFPFVLSGQTYNRCTRILDDASQPWCSTKVDSDGNHLTGNWGHCTRPGCPLEPTTTTTTTTTTPPPSDLCSSFDCGDQAECYSNERVVVCRCPNGLVGDPYTKCYFDMCQPNPCGRLATCSSEDEKAVCKCLDGYVGNPYSERCYVNPCNPDPCGTNAQCLYNNRGQATCECLDGYGGNPKHFCQELTPCFPNPCGENADCILRNRRVPTCQCSRGFTGDPITQCKLYSLSKTIREHW